MVRLQVRFWSEKELVSRATFKKSTHLDSNLDSYWQSNPYRSVGCCLGRFAAVVGCPRFDW